MRAKSAVNEASTSQVNLLADDGFFHVNAMQ
ncbi:hypothetical protein J2X72_002923 [Phyllobacterium sp. 1468]|nr:hypothetical protein [Phyllobacterium sp. 1468]